MQLSTKARFCLVLFFAILLSAGGIVYSIWVTHDPLDAGRGGALAVALSLATLFLSRSYGSRVYSLLTKDAERAADLVANIRGLTGHKQPLVKAEEKVDALFEKVRIDAENQESQNFYLAWSSAIGTLAWGFGDIIAGWMM